MDHTNILLISLGVTLFLVACKVIFDRFFDRVWDNHIETKLENFLTEKVPAFKVQTPHCQHPRLMAVMSAYKAHQFDVLESMLIDFPEDFRSFSLKMFSEMGDKNITEAWVASSESDIARVVMAMHAVYDAWNVRGGGFSNTVSNKQAMGFHELLRHALETLQNIDNDHSDYSINRLVTLLTVYKGLGVESQLIHDAFRQGLALSPQHIELHETYFDAISPKWGGTHDEVATYLKTLPTEPKLLVDIIWAMYYRDVLHVELEKDPDVIQEIRNFVIRVAAKDYEPDELHRATLYEYMSDIARIESFALEERFGQLYDDCFKHSWQV